MSSTSPTFTRNRLRNNRLDLLIGIPHRDIGLVVPVMKPDGIMKFHDYGVQDLGVTGAVDEFAKGRGLKVEVVRTLAIVRLAP